MSGDSGYRCKECGWFGKSGTCPVCGGRMAPADRGVFILPDGEVYRTNKKKNKPARYKPSQYSPAQYMPSTSKVSEAGGDESYERSETREKSQKRTWSWQGFGNLDRSRQGILFVIILVVFSVGVSLIENHVENNQNSIDYDFEDAVYDEYGMYDESIQDETNGIGTWYSNDDFSIEIMDAYAFDFGDDGYDVDITENGDTLFFVANLYIESFSNKTLTFDAQNDFQLIFDNEESTYAVNAHSSIQEDVFGLDMNTKISMAEGGYLEVVVPMDRKYDHVLINFEKDGYQTTFELDNFYWAN